MNKKIKQYEFALKILQAILVVLISGVFILLNVADANSQTRSKAKNKKSISSKTRKTTSKPREREREEDEKPVVIVRNGKKYYLTEDRDLARFDKPNEAQKAYLEQR